MRGWRVDFLGMRFCDGDLYVYWGLFLEIVFVKEMKEVGFGRERWNCVVVIEEWDDEY